MRSFFVIILLCAAYPTCAGQTFSATSPTNRVALIELYTSEGCSSCPPADRFISQLKKADISDQQLVPLAFHVTYWDYIGWRDRFGSKQYDDRQRKQALLNASRTVYTPQFLLNGKDFRRYRALQTELAQINAQTAPFRLEMVAEAEVDRLIVRLNVERLHERNGEAVIYIALYEHGLSSEVTDGENEGEYLRHDYVVRKLAGPFHARQFPYMMSSELRTEKGWELENMGLAAFAQKPLSSEVLQTVNLGFHKSGDQTVD